MISWKETDFGKIPWTWDVKRISDIKASDKRALAMGPFGSNIKAENFVDQGVPVIRGANLSFDKFVDGEFVFLTNEKADELIGSVCVPGDLIFTHRGTIGQVAIIPKNKFSRYIVSQSGMKLTVNSDLVDSDFLFYFFKSEFGQHQILKYESQVGVPSIGNPLTSLKAIQVPVPPLLEQKAIASILNSLDEKTDLLYRQNAILEKMGEALFRQWFVMEAKENWRKATLGDVIALNYGKALKEEVRTGLGFPVVGSSGIVGYHSEFLVESPGIVIGRKGTLGKVNYLFDNFFPIDTTYFVESKINSKGLYFEYFLLKSLNLKEMNSDSAVPGLNRNIALSTEITLPRKEKVIDFNMQCASFFQKIRFNQNQIRTLKALHGVLLPKLVSGEVRIKV